MRGAACPPVAKAYDTDGVSATSSAVVATGQDIVGVSVSPATPHAGDTAVVSVTGSPTCGAVGIDYGDGTVIVSAIVGLPSSQYHITVDGAQKRSACEFGLPVS